MQNNRLLFYFQKKIWYIKKVALFRQNALNFFSITPIQFEDFFMIKKELIFFDLIPKKQVKISSYINIIINKIERILSEKCKVSQYK